MKSDVWSSGITLFIMLCGDLPFKQNDIDSLYYTILKEKVQYPEFLSEKAKNFLDLLLQKNPWQRVSFEQALMHEWIQDNKPDNFQEMFEASSRDHPLEVHRINDQ